MQLPHKFIVLLPLLTLAGWAQDTERIVAENEPAAVVIVGKRLDTGAEVQSSGCCIHPEGYILTTAHQIDGVAEFQAHFADGSTQPLSVVALEVDKEIALLKTAAPVKHYARVGNAQRLRNGSPLIAIATPLNMSFSAVQGIVSSINRTYNGYPVLQADLSASPGSSGGPVFDRYGNLVGLIIGELRQEDRVTVVNPVNNAYPILQQHGVLEAALLESDPELLRPDEDASAIERDAIEAYNAGVSAPDPAAKARAYEKAVELVPQFYHAWFNLGVAYAQLDQAEAAERAYRKAAELNTNSVEPRRNLGRLLLRERRPDEALTVLEEALALAPDAPQSYNDIGESYRQLTRYDDAIRMFEEALARKADYAQARYNLALSHAALGRNEAAVQHFEAYLKTAPEVEDAEAVRAIINKLTAQTP